MSTLNTILSTSLSIPGVKIDRTTFLRKELSVIYDKDTVQKAIETNPSNAGISLEQINKIADNCIKYHLKASTTASFIAGLPGGIALIGTVPADMAQFYSNILKVAQKLAYLYGWPDLSKNNQTDELKNMLGLFLGVMFGVSQANKLVMEISKRLATEIIKRLPQKSLTKYVWYNILTQILRWLGIKLTKDTFAKALSKAVPIIGGFVSGTITYTTMKTMTGRLQKELRNGPLANMSKLSEEDYVNPDENIKIDNIIDVEEFKDIN